ncbi:hypothetical protein B0A50_01143 [Salinomyces thailandicus]|uniref:Bromo domain-containing protein n=1 Tax=Salinomyces thailandicus TaxID=706561 RepID=A0A4U0UCJ8_9PEZI|nr:hypothetical protein B0A50_01143 [Salinomyces thailandica]
MLSYTPLESLLLFQALRAEAGQPETFSFARISEHLKKIALVRDDPSYSEARLGPKALRDCYLGLVKEEARKDMEDEREKANGTTNGDISPASRKRKAPSPAIPTVQEAAQFPHLIPRLVERLYQSYRANTVKQIREHERQYDALSREVSEIEDGKWDDRLQDQQCAPTSATHSPRPSTIAHTQPNIPQPVQAPSTASPTAGSTSQQQQADPKVPAKKYSQATIDAVMNHGPEPQNSPGGHRRTSSNTKLPPLSEMAPHSPRYGIPAQVPPMAPQMPPHIQQRPQHPHYVQSPPQMHQPSYGPPAHSHPVQSPQLQSAMSRPSSSPRPILPPPPGMHLASQSPGPYSGPHHAQAQHMAHPHPHQQYPQSQRSSVSRPPPDHRPPPGYQPQAPHTPQYYSPSHAPHQPYQNPRMPYQAPPGSHPPAYAPSPVSQLQRPGRELPPFAVDSVQHGTAVRQPYVQQQHQQTPRPPGQLMAQTTSRPPYSQPHYPPQAPATGPRPQPQSKLMSGILASLATPPRHLRAQHRPLWKNDGSPAPSRRPPEPLQPEVEPMSPVRERSKPQPPAGKSNDASNDRLPQQPMMIQPKGGWERHWEKQRLLEEQKLKERQEAVKQEVERHREQQRQQRQQQKQQKKQVAQQKQPQQKQQMPLVPPIPPMAQRPIRGGSPGSTPSSTAAEMPNARTRSQSVSTTAGTSVAGDRRGSRADVKMEPSTPAEAHDSPELLHEPSATSNSGPMTRKRRGTLQSNPQTASKRKRQHSPPPGEQETQDDATPPPSHRPNTILATRNFAKVASAIMNDITSHKHASYFASGVRDKDANGYSEIIKQPQHLKSIRAAITAGTRAVAAASSSSSATATNNTDSPSTSLPTTPAILSTSKASDGSTVVELEASTDLMPPKAIVNAAQLEKEVYRMFANAVMFNPGEDGLVADTREMFGDVEAGMRAWRGAERE